MRTRELKTILLSTAALIAVAATVTSTGSMAGKSPASNKPSTVGADTLPTKTPIKHLVVVFNENRSFDHYFGTYPNALEPRRRARFRARQEYTARHQQSFDEPGAARQQSQPEPGQRHGAANPFRLDRTQANTADQNHGYTPEQKAYDGGKNDLFPLNTGQGTSGGAGAFGTNGQVMGYFDGNTVTALWNYAQNYAMSDNAWADHFGPSTPGALNMFAGQTNGFTLPVGVPARLPRRSVSFCRTGATATAA